MKYKIGQILTSNRDIEVEKMFGEKVIIPKGNKIIIGADKFAHHLKDGMIQPLQECIIVDGYDTEGIAEYLTKKLSAIFPLEEMLEDYDIEKARFEEEIDFLLDDIGFQENRRMTIIIYAMCVKTYCEVVGSYAEFGKFMVAGIVMWLGHIVIKYLFDDQRGCKR